MQFKTVEAYIEALRADPGLAMIPLGLVAELKGISRSAVAEQIKSGALDCVEVEGKRRTWRGVPPSALFAQQDRTDSEAVERRRSVAAMLEVLARDHRTTTYAAIMEAAGMTSQNPRHRAVIGAVLADLSRQSHQAHDFMIGALVVQKSTGRPNAQFFDLAREIGALVGDLPPGAFWRAQCGRIFAHYAQAAAPV